MSNSKKRYSNACGGPGTSTDPEGHGAGEMHVHAIAGNGKRLPGHVFFNPDLWEDIFDIAIPGPVVPDFIFDPEQLLHPDEPHDGA